MCCPITDPGPNFSPAPLLRQAAAGSRLLLLCPAGVTRRRRRGGVANLPLPAQLLGMDKKSFELWSLPLISAWGRPRCCPPASKAPPRFCPPAVARPLDSQLIFFLPAPAAQSCSRGRAFFFSLPTSPDQLGPRGALGFGLQALRVLRDEEIDPAAPRAWPAFISSVSCAHLATLISLLLISCGVCT